jgi:hypothetical protein
LKGALSGYRNLILTISPRKNESRSSPNAETQKQRITTILATLMPRAGRAVASWGNTMGFVCSWMGPDQKPRKARPSLKRALRR